MRVARSVSAECPRCGDDGSVWLVEKDEGPVTKLLYSCEACGCEWSDVRQD